MATVKKANVPPTHPTVWVGLGLAVVGLLLAMFAYTGARVYDITYAFVAIGGGALALAGIMTAAWGRSIMSARASRSRRTAFAADAMAVAKPAEDARTSEDAPTIAAPRSKRAFSFPIPKRAKKEEKPANAGAVFAFKRREAPATAPAAAPEGAPEEPLVRLVDAPPRPIRATLKCPQCAERFTVEGVRPFDAKCPGCGFASTV